MATFFTEDSSEDDILAFSPFSAKPSSKKNVATKSMKCKEKPNRAVEEGNQSRRSAVLQWKQNSKVEEDIAEAVGELMYGFSFQLQVLFPHSVLLYHRALQLRPRLQWRLYLRESDPQINSFGTRTRKVGIIPVESVNVPKLVFILT